MEKLAINVWFQRNVRFTQTQTFELIKNKPKNKAISRSGLEWQAAQSSRVFNTIH
jgi:hypothetical protein